MDFLQTRILLPVLGEGHQQIKRERRKGSGMGKLKAMTWQAEQEDPDELSALILDGSERDAIDRLLDAVPHTRTSFRHGTW
jgi:hypothetical protein